MKIGGNERGLLLNFTLIIGIYGAVLATLTAIWVICQITREWRNLIIEGGIAWNPNNPDKKALIIKVTNNGKRPIQVESFQAYPSKRAIKKGDVDDVRFYSAANWPLKLDEGDSTDLVIEEFDFVASGKYQYFFVVDSLGKRWEMSGKVRRNIEEGARAAGR
jgi:hypothetical protein